MRSRILLLLPALLLAPGCYTYEPVQPAHPEAEAAIRAHMRTPQDVPLNDRTLHGVIRVDGRMLRTDSVSLVLAANRFESSTGREQTALGNLVTLPLADIEVVEEKQFDWLRSGAFAGAVLAGVFLIDRTLDQLIGQSDTGNGGGNPNPR